MFPVFSIKSKPPANSKQAAATIWIIYLALLLGELFFCGVIGLILSNNNPPVAAPKPNQILIVICGIFLSTIPVGFFVHRILIKKALAASNPVSFQKFSTAYVIYWATCEMPAFFSLVVVMIHRNFYPTIIFFAIAFICQAAMFPRTRLLRPANDTFKIE